MIRITCPWCGVRDHAEFVYGGAADRVRPADDATLRHWTDFVYLRTNPAGPHAELWQHAAGCRRWLRVERDTRTHRTGLVRDVQTGWEAGGPEESGHGQ